jgi:hypothetical protein
LQFDATVAAGAFRSEQSFAVADVNPLLHRYYLADLERSARARPRRRRHGPGRDAAARLLEVARRLLARARAREA